MTKSKRLFAAVAASVFLVCFTALAGTGPVADVNFEDYAIHWLPNVHYGKLVLTVSCPDGSVFRKAFNTELTPHLELSDLKGSACSEGVYTYELRVFPAAAQRVRRDEDERLPLKKPLAQSGYFSIQGGKIVSSRTSEREPGRTLDVPPIPDDLIVQGSLCVGIDCEENENFGYDTIKLKENNLRIYFHDTSYMSSFPSNDWRIVINDIADGGASYFAVEDSDAEVMPFLIEAGAPANALYVEDYGRVGLGTSTPMLELHIVDGDTPALRLEQDGSGGWTPQVWDVAGNESNFFIRDGSRLPFRIRPGAPTNSIYIENNGHVGMGTANPAYPLHMAGGAYCDGKSWQDASSRVYKENIESLDAKDAVETLKGLNPVRFNYKTEPEEEHLGFVAEDVPELVASKGRKGLSAMDIVALLTRVVQEQQKRIAALERKLEAKR